MTNLAIHSSSGAQDRSSRPAVPAWIVDPCRERINGRVRAKFPSETKAAENRPSLAPAQFATRRRLPGLPKSQTADGRFTLLQQATGNMPRRLLNS